MEGNTPLQQKSFEFALSIIRLHRKLQARQELVISPHLFHSGTKIGVSVVHASTAANQPSRVSQLIAAAAAARETQYWLQLLQASRLTDVDVTLELNQLSEVIELLTQTMGISRENSKD